MRILNFGSVNIDYVYRVEHFVRPGETLSARSVTKNAGGKGFNQSVALAKAGCQVYHAGHIGNDGTFLLDLCHEYGIHTDYLTEVDAPTGSTVIQVDDNGDNCILLSGGANLLMDQDFIGQVLNDFQNGDLIVLQNEINCMNDLLYLAHEKGLKIAINPAPMNNTISRDALKLADWIILNETEAQELTGAVDSIAQLERLTEEFPHSAFLLTLGSKGAICQIGSYRCHTGACQVEAVDTTAAGDTFTGFFLSAILSNQEPAAALLTATRASALAVMKKGAAKSIPTLAEVQECPLIPEVF
ncbi:MAG: ribokinase [Clostridiales bacterium]|nr:ribokinase [Clostridiales bacterium]